jgi:transposase InsO family protein
MPTTSPRPRIPIPRQWSRLIQSATLHIIALAQYALVYTRSWAGNSSSQRVQLAGRVNQLEQEVGLLREEIRIKDARMGRVPASQRPHYHPTERLAILELRAARGWSVARVASVFQVTAATISSWTKRVDEDGPGTLLQTREPVNKFPDFVRGAVQRLQTLCPLMGKLKIAQVLARAGLHLSATTVGRIRREEPATPPAPPHQPTETMPSARRVTAKRPNHVWHVDLTVVPTAAGMWASWLPFALPQCWPFCWWLGIVVDHYSRRALGSAVFKKQPTSVQVRQFLGRVIATIGTAPKYLVTDSGVQFTCAAFKPWCRRHGIRHRKGAVGRPGSIAVVERFIRTFKDGCTRLLPVVPLTRCALRRELDWFVRWYNAHRPHTTLSGATPDEVYFARGPACRAPRFEPRPGWPRASPCASPQTLVKGQPGVALELTVTCLGRRRHLPLVSLKRAA